MGFRSCRWLLGPRLTPGYPRHSATPAQGAEPAPRQILDQRNRHPQPPPTITSASEATGKFVSAARQTALAHRPAHCPAALMRLALTPSAFPKFPQLLLHQGTAGLTGLIWQQEAISTSTPPAHRSTSTSTEAGRPARRLSSMHQEPTFVTRSVPPPQQDPLAASLRLLHQHQGTHPGQ